MSASQLLLTFIIAFLLILKGQLAFGGVALELKPVAASANLVPGASGFGGGIEFGGDGHWAGFAEWQHIGVVTQDEHRPVIATKEVRPGELIDVESHSSAITQSSAGVRFYGIERDDSWYVGMRVIGAVESAQWRFGTESIDDLQKKRGAGLDLGYRWLWGTHFLTRLGVGASSMSTVSRELSGTVVDSTLPTAKLAVLEAAPNDKSTVRTVLDFGLGYTF